MKRKVDCLFYGCYAVFLKIGGDASDYPVAVFMGLHEAEIFVENIERERGVTDMYYIKELVTNYNNYLVLKE